MNTILKYRYLIIITVVAIFLRFWQLGMVPPSPDWDEAALGYNAYSILKTGRDEYGTLFPAVIRSFDDYKPPLYVYLTIPSVALFGLNTLSVRLPSSVMGVLAVVGTYFLVREFMRLNERDSKWYGEALPLLSSFLLAISPWHLQFSRIAFEANTGVTLNVWGLYFFLTGLKKSWKLSLSAFLFALALYAYHSERLFVPLLVLILAAVFSKDLLKHKKPVFVAIVVGIVALGPLLTVFFDQNTLTRLRGTSSLSDQTALLARTVKKLDYDRLHHDIAGLVLDNRRFVWISTLVSGYLSHYSLRWWFLTGDNARHHAPEMGLLYLWELPFLLWGMYTVYARGGKLRAILFGWFLIAPVAASPTTELPHAIRTLVFLPSLQIFTAVGIVSLIHACRGQTIKKIAVGLLTLAVIVSGIYYLHMYYGHLNEEYSEFWQYGYKEAVAYADAHKNQYKKIVVSIKLEQPHMFFLYFLRYDPVKYLASGGTRSGGFAEVRNAFDKYEFRDIHWDSEVRDGSILYIGLPSEVPAGEKIIYYLDGKEAMHIADH